MRAIERQLGKPSRFTAKVLNRVNARTNGRAVERLGPQPGDRALDVGFGGGVGLALLAGRAAFVAGIDHSGPAVAAARTRFADDIAAGRMQLEQASVDAIPFGDDSFDRVLGVHTVYFWRDPDRALREILRVLAPGGRLLLATDSNAAPKAMARHGFKSYSADEEAALLTAAGFADVGLDAGPRTTYAVATKPA